MTATLLELRRRWIKPEPDSGSLAGEIHLEFTSSGAASLSISSADGNTRLMVEEGGPTTMQETISQLRSALYTFEIACEKEADNG